MKKLLFAALLFLSSCSTTTVMLGDTMPPVKPNYKETQHFFIAGLGQEKLQDPREICSVNGVNTIKVYYSFVDAVLMVFTGGIYTPNTYEVYCNRSK